MQQPLMYPATRGLLRLLLLATDTCTRHLSSCSSPTNGADTIFFSFFVGSNSLQVVATTPCMLPSRVVATPCMLLPLMVATPRMLLPLIVATPCMLLHATPDSCYPLYGSCSCTHCCSYHICCYQQKHL